MQVSVYVTHDTSDSLYRLLSDLKVTKCTLSDEQGGPPVIMIDGIAHGPNDLESGSHVSLVGVLPEWNEDGYIDTLNIMNRAAIVGFDVPGYPQEPVDPRDTDPMLRP